MGKREEEGGIMGEQRCGYGQKGKESVGLWMNWGV